MTPARLHDWVDLAFGLFIGGMTAVSGWLWLGTPAAPLGVLVIILGISACAGALVAWWSERR